MIKKTSTSFRSFWFAILVFLLNNAAVTEGRTISGKVIDFSIAFDRTSVFPNAKAFVIDMPKYVNGSYSLSTHQNQYIFTLSQLSFEAYKLPEDVNAPTNILLNESLITLNEMAPTALHLSSHHSI